MGELAIALFCGVSISVSGFIALGAIKKIERETVASTSVIDNKKTTKFEQELLQQNIAVK